LGPVDRQAVLNQPFPEIGPGDGVDRDGSLVLVAINFDACHRSARHNGQTILPPKPPPKVIGEPAPGACFSAALMGRRPFPDIPHSFR
jgi:hypothetical protein